jgi:predicted nuclease of predicted toxin-antitoxin system
VRFLIDECLSPELARLARTRGHPDSTPVSWLGMASRKDWTISRRAVDEGFILVTNNTVDFIALYRREPLHAGLICLNAAPKLMNLELQERLFRLAMAKLLGSEPDNEVLEITASAAGQIRIERYRFARD